MAINSDHGLSFAGKELGPWSEFPFLYRFTVLLNSGGSNSPWSEFWSEFPHFMGMGVVPAPSNNMSLYASVWHLTILTETIASEQRKNNRGILDSLCRIAKAKGEDP